MWINKSRRIKKEIWYWHVPLTNCMKWRMHWPGHWILQTKTSIVSLMGFESNRRSHLLLYGLLLEIQQLSYLGLVNVNFRWSLLYRHRTLSISHEYKVTLVEFIWCWQEWNWFTIGGIHQEYIIRIIERLKCHISNNAFRWGDVMLIMK